MSEVSNVVPLDLSAVFPAALSTMLEALPIPVFCKTEDGRYLDCNELFLGFIDRPREEIIGHTVFELFDAEKAEVSISDNVKVEVVKATGIQALVSGQEVKK